MYWAGPNRSCEGIETRNDTAGTRMHFQSFHYPRWTLNFGSGETCAQALVSKPIVPAFPRRNRCAFVPTRLLCVFELQRDRLPRMNGQKECTMENTERACARGTQHHITTHNKIRICHWCSRRQTCANQDSAVGKICFAVLVYHGTNECERQCLRAQHDWHDWEPRNQCWVMRALNPFPTEQTVLLRAIQVSYLGLSP